MNFLKDPRAVTVLVLLAIAAMVWDYYQIIGGGSRTPVTVTTTFQPGKPATPPAGAPTSAAPSPAPGPETTLPSMPSAAAVPAPVGKVPFYDLVLTDRDPFQEGTASQFGPVSERGTPILPPPPGGAAGFPEPGSKPQLPPPPPPVTVKLISLFRAERKAILETAETSYIVQVGDKIGEETVTAIEEDGVFLKGVTASRWVRLPSMTFAGSSTKNPSATPKSTTRVPPREAAAS